MFHNVPPSSSASQSCHHSGVEEKPGSPKVGERRHKGLPRRALSQGQPGILHFWVMAPRSPGAFHVSLKATELWSVGGMYYSLLDALKRVWKRKLPKLTERLYVGES